LLILSLWIIHQITFNLIFWQQKKEQQQSKKWKRTTNNA
jgi:hypothetical protein